MNEATITTFGVWNGRAVGHEAYANAVVEVVDPVRLAREPS